MGAQEDYEQVQSFAERLGLEDKEKDSFINSSMQRLGYKPRMEWSDPEPEDGGGGGDFFSGKREQRQQRRVGGDGGRRASGGGAWSPYDN